MDKPYPKTHVMAMMGLNTITVLIGLALAVGPFLKHYFPGDIDTTAHVALGAIITTLALFRVALAYGSIWVDMCLMAFGVIVCSMPKIMHMQWASQYTMSHMIAGVIIIAVALISSLLTVATLSKMAKA